MKRVFLAAVIGLSVIGAATSMASNGTADKYVSSYTDTVPEKDTTQPKPDPKPDPAPDSSSISSLSAQ